MDDTNDIHNNNNNNIDHTRQQTDISHISDNETFVRHHGHNDTRNMSQEMSVDHDSSFHGGETHV
jgi:hypothetical protein